MRQEEDLDARDPDGLEVDENRDVLEERLGEPDRQAVPVDGETGTQREQERSAHARDREAHDPEPAPQHSQCHEADEQRNAQVAGRIGRPWRRAQDRPEKIDVERRDHTGRLNAVSDPARTCKEVADRIAGYRRETSARCDKPGHRRADTS